LQEFANRGQSEFCAGRLRQARMVE